MRVSAIIPTRNRGDQILPAVESVLQSRGPEFLELVLIDQSTSDASYRALEGSGLLADARLRYVRVDQTGASRARNTGMRHARAELLAFTDDDCLVPTTWVSDLAHRFRTQPELAILYPVVAPAPNLDGFIPTFRPRETGELSLSLEVVHDLGFTANSAVRRSSLESIGPFDELLGAGTPFVSEDKDFGYRALRAGLRVELAYEPAVVHYGVRQGSEVAELGRQYTAGFGAMAAKHVRCGDRYMARVLGRELKKWLMLALRSAPRGRRPSGLGHAKALLEGVVGSYRFGVDPQTRLFYLRGEPSPSPASLIARTL